MADGDAEVTRRVPACEQVDVIQSRLAELRRERDEARGWEAPAEQPAETPAAWHDDPNCRCPKAINGGRFHNPYCKVHGTLAPVFGGGYVAA